MQLPLSHKSSSLEEQTLKKHNKNLLNSPKSPLSLNLYRYCPHLWLLIFFIALQIFLFLTARSIPTSVHHFPPPQNPLPSAAAADKNEDCPLGKVYVYDLPPQFNTQLLRNCNELNPWVSSPCNNNVFSNYGFGRRVITGLDKIMPESLAGGWYRTDQFALEVIYHNRMMNYQCRVLEPESATAFYIPLYAGLAVGRYLWHNYSASDRDRDCVMMLRWIQNQTYYKRSDGWDHFITMGRISWDFRRSKDEDWGSSCIYMPGMRNITRLLIERNPWDYFDVGVPYPTGFHPTTESHLSSWQEFVRTRNRTTLFCFAGATRGFIKNDFRGTLLSQCYNSTGSCRVVDCGGSKCSNGTSSAILETFLDSDFCLQPRGDSFTRRSIFDCMIAGSIPVFFWRRTAYYQYQWFLPDEPESFSVFIDRNAVKNGTSIERELEKIPREVVESMREKVIEYIPKFVYANQNKGKETIRDAFTVAIEGVLNRIKEQEEAGYKW